MKWGVRKIKPQKGEKRKKQTYYRVVDDKSLTDRRNKSHMYITGSREDIADYENPDFMPHLNPKTMRTVEYDAELTIASNETGEKVFKDLKKDKNFNKALQKKTHLENGKDVKNLNDYKTFVSSLRNESSEGKQFYSKLKELGYDGFVDAYEATAFQDPLIIINPDKLKMK